MKKLFIISVLLGFAAVLPAQNKVYHVPVQAQNSIVRNYIPNSKWIVYYEDNASQHRFALTDLNDFFDVTINADFSVKDFEVVGDTVIFCGTNNQSTAFIGWFHIPTFFASASSYQIDYTISAAGVNTLDNIEAYRNPTTGFLHIAGFGHSSASTTNNLCVFEAVCSAANLSVMSYRVKLVNCIDGFFDMTVTDNYVVFGGGDSIGSTPQQRHSEIVLFPFPRYNMLGNSSDTCYRFSAGSTSGENEPYDSQMRMTFVGGNTVAMATLKSDPQSSGNFLFLRKCDVGNPASMSILAKVNFGSISGSIAGIEYSQTEGTYYVLCGRRYSWTRMAAVGTISRFDFLSGIPPAAINDLYQYAIGYHSLCKDNGYLASGVDNLNNELVLYRGLMPYTTGCDSGFQETVLNETSAAPTTSICGRSATSFVQANWMNKLIVNFQHLPVDLLCD